MPTRRSDDLALSCPDGVDQSGDARVAGLEAEVCALRERDAQARLILDSATDYAISTMDNDGCVTSWNGGPP